MKMIRAVFGLVLFLALLSSQPAVAGSDGTNLPCRVTYELRDGSRAIGQSDDDFIRFHSPLLGDLKLAVPEIRTVERIATNSAKLTTTQGDTLTVSFADSRLTARTSFGKIKLSVDSIRKLTMSTGGMGGARRPGLVALWSGEDNGRDVIGTNDAELTDMDFADGQVGRAFLLNGNSSTIKISGSSANVGVGSGFTLGAWINPADVSKNNPIFEWVQAGIPAGTQFYIYPPDGGPGTLYALIGDTGGGAHYFFSSPGVVMPNVFQYVALTYDKASGMAKIYCNGVVVAQQYLGSFTPQTSCDLYLGKRPLISGETYGFTGLFDEAAIYDHALSAAEIMEICTEDNHGQALRPPVRFPRNLPFRNGIIND